MSKTNTSKEDTKGLRLLLLPGTVVSCSTGVGRVCVDGRDVKTGTDRSEVTDRNSG